MAYFCVDAAHKKDGLAIPTSLSRQQARLAYQIVIHTLSNWDTAAVTFRTVSHL